MENLEKNGMREVSYDVEKEAKYALMSISDRKILYEYCEIVHGKPSTKKRYRDLFCWASDTGNDLCDISRACYNQIIKKYGEEVYLNLDGEIIKTVATSEIKKVELPDATSRTPNPETDHRLCESAGVFCDSPQPDPIRAESQTDKDRGDNARNPRPDNAGTNWDESRVLW